MPPKKKVAGDAGKGEKVFKNLCAVCHNFAVLIYYNQSFYSHTVLAPTFWESSAQMLPQKKVSTIRKLSVMNLSNFIRKR